MATEVNPVDDKYKEKKVRHGHSTPLLDLNKRKVTQEDIDNLGLDKLEYDNEGKSKLGKLTNIYHE